MISTDVQQAMGELGLGYFAKRAVFYHNFEDIQTYDKVVELPDAFSFIGTEEGQEFWWAVHAMVSTWNHLKYQDPIHPIPMFEKLCGETVRGFIQLVAKIIIVERDAGSALFERVVEAHLRRHRGESHSSSLADSIANPDDDPNYRVAACLTEVANWKGTPEGYYFWRRVFQYLKDTEEDCC